MTIELLDARIRKNAAPLETGLSQDGTSDLVAPRRERWSRRRDCRSRVGACDDLGTRMMSSWKLSHADLFIGRHRTLVAACWCGSMVARHTDLDGGSGCGVQCAAVAQCRRRR